MISNKELRATYGKHAVITRRGKFILVHLDRPSRELARARAREFDPEKYFFDDCPLCRRAQTEGGVVLFDDSEYEDEIDEEILMD